MNTDCRGAFFPFAAFLLLIITAFSAFLFFEILPNQINTQTTDTSVTERITTVILDAGHGGEDGGASSASGIVEKDLNLKITLLLRDILEANGVNVILTRDTDILLYDRNVDYHGRKKMLDLAARKKAAEEHPDAVFISIHMNTYPSDACQGLQVWYSPNNIRSHTLASEIQKRAKEYLNPQNDREVKRAGSSIYLLNKITSPAVLIECGFLSNPQEAELLGTEAYQRAIAHAIFLAIVHTEFEAEET